MDKKRQDIPEKYKWDLSRIYINDEAFYKDLDLLEKTVSAFPAHESTMTLGAEGLYLALADMEAIQCRINRLWEYAFLGFALDNSDNEAQARCSRVRTASVRADEATWFVTPRILKLEEVTLESWYKEYPRLSEFRRMMFKIMREKPHTLSDECERLMSRLGDALDSHSDIRGVFANSDLKYDDITDEEGKSVPLRDTNYVTYLMSGDRRVREDAFTTLYKTYRQFGNTFAGLYASYVRERCALAKARGYESSLHASVFSDEVTPDIYNALIKSVREALPVFHDYYRLKKDALGVEKIHMYDLYAPLVPSFEREYGYEEAIDALLDTCSVFGKEYYDVLREGVTEKRWVDVYPAEGKQGGAFSAGCYGIDPYILLNYNSTFSDVSTLLHEAGHSMHSYFSRKDNASQDAYYTIFVAEVASTVNELLLIHKRLRESECREEKLYILDSLMETYKGTLFRQTMFAEFEKWAHESVWRGEPLTKDSLCAYYKQLVSDYFGDEVEIDEDIAYEWMRIPHFYTAFYVYKYATCISAASAIVKRIENEGERYIEKYIDFLKIGGSKSPLESLLVCGIDMTDPEVVRSAVEDFAEAIKAFRELSK
ncbi:MAG: oligoendopeptidase F [Clostridia bacterium]|nr:oligoendopeptidase F [Clostridia bacterium]